MRRTIKVGFWIVVSACALSGPRTAAQSTPASSTSAFFYQTVNPAQSTVRAGATSDGSTVRTYDSDLVNALVRETSTGYGDPVFSRMENGRWAMTAWTRPDDSRGDGLMYFEADCPAVDAGQVRVFTASSAAGCRPQNPSMAKSSQVFAVDGSNYIFTMSRGEIYLTRLTSPTTTAADLSSICVRSTAVNSIHDLARGDAGRVVSSSDVGELLLSDVAIARRKEGTWVLFFKGISSASGCAQGSICELCSRSIYRMLSLDLIHWSSLETVVAQASVPEAVTYPDGSTWLYYQNFAKACAANDVRLADRAAISGVYELPGGTLSQPIDVKFSNEAFETNTSLHYPTNGNPIALPDETSYAALNACLGRSPR